jgi:hypothetical protein
MVLITGYPVVIVIVVIVIRQAAAVSADKMCEVSIACGNIPKNKLLVRIK